MDDNLLVMAATYEPHPAQAERLVDMMVSFGCRVLVVDNSTSDDGRERVRRACEAAGVPLLAEGSNLGTAGALNAGLREGRSLEAAWLLYFDQDSEVDSAHLRRAQETAATASLQTMAIGCRVVHLGEMSAPVTPSLTPATWAISSGTLFRVPHLVALGGFDEAFGLDLVDHEICLRIRRAGGVVALDTGRHIVHEIGRGGRSAGWRGMRVTRHPAWRRRLMWRNSVLLCRRYARRERRLCARHLLGRIWETLVGAAVFRDPAWLVAAACGLVDGMRAETDIIGLGAPPETAGRARLP